MIVPDFGGFMTHEVSARYDEADRSFVPPVRTLGFNPQLRLNDSLLAQSYVEAYDLSYPEALRRIEQEVAELTTQLNEQGSYEMENLGRLTVNQEGNYEFEPCEAGILSPDLYGLGGFQMRRLKDRAADVVPLETAQETTAGEEEPRLLDITATSDDHEADHAITIRMSWLRGAVAVAAAVIAFFLVSTPVDNSNLATPAMSRLNTQMLYKLIPQDTNASQPETTEAIEAVAAEPVSAALPAPVSTSKQAPADKATTTNEQASANTEAPVYCIIVASQVKRTNADDYATRLQQRGFEDARVLVKSGVVRVACGQFKTEGEAYRQLNRMNTDEEFYDAWVMRVQG